MFDWFRCDSLRKIQHKDQKEREVSFSITLQLWRFLKATQFFETLYLAKLRTFFSPLFWLVPRSFPSAHLRTFFCHGKKVAFWTIFHLTASRFCEQCLKVLYLTFNRRKKSLVLSCAISNLCYWCLGLYIVNIWRFAPHDRSPTINDRSLWRRTSAWNVCSLWWPIYIIDSVDKTKLYRRWSLSFLW